MCWLNGRPGRPVTLKRRKAWRLFLRGGPDGGKLYPIGRFTGPYVVGVRHKAKCRCESHRHKTIPTRMGNCGFYVFRKKEEAEKAKLNRREVCLEVMVSGRAIPYKNGWRVQYMTIPKGSA